MHGQLVAMLHSATDLVDFRKIKAGRHTLGIQVERNVDQIHIACALTVAEKTAFNAIGTSHQGKFTCRRSGTPVVVRVD